MCDFYLAGLFLHLLLEELHGIGLCLLGNLDIGLHGLVVGVAGPLHHNLRRDTSGEGETDEGTPGSMGTNQVALGGSLLHTFSTLVVNLGDGRVEAYQLAEVLQIAVLQLIGQHRQCTVIREVAVLVLLQDLLGELVQIDGKAVMGRI